MNHPRTMTCRAMPAALLILAVAAGCERGPAPSAGGDNRKDPSMSFELTSAAFDNGQTIPKQFTGEGRDLSPPLAWSDPPAGARAYALICDDPDAPNGTWVHWLIWNIPGDRTDLPEGLPRQKMLPQLGDARQGANSWPKDNIGYRGPMPPPGHGPHRYIFTLYALNGTLDLGAGATKRQLLDAIAGHELGTAKLTGMYERK